HQSRKMLGCAVSIEGGFVSIHFPKGEYVRVFGTPRNIEPDDAGFFDRGLAQLSKQGLGFVRVLRSKGILDRRYDHCLYLQGNGRSALAWRPVCERNKRFPFFDEVSGEFSSVTRSDVLRRVDHACQDEQDIAWFDCYRWLVPDPVLKRPFQDIDDLFAKMRMPRRNISRVKVDAHLHSFASRYA